MNLKKIISPIIAVSLSFGMISANVNYKPVEQITISAQDSFTLEDGLVFDISHGYIRIIGCDKEREEYEIPYTIDGKIVRYISNPGFANAKLKTITIPDSVLGIEEGTFYGCTELEAVVIPDSVTKIGKDAFKDCTKLADITFSKNIEFIFADAFDNTAWYENQTDDIVYINNLLYKGKNTEIISAEVQDGTLAIVPNAFTGCNQLTEISIPASVKRIPDKSVGYYYVDGELCKADNFKIYGYAGTTAEKYATANEFEFIPLINKGDVNSDNIIDSTDALLVLQAVINEITLDDEQIKYSDMDDDGEITSQDALEILQIVVGIR